MKTETKQRIKLALRRFTLRWLRKLVDVADDRLHAAEVKLRKEIAARNPVVDAPHGINGSATTEPLASREGSEEAAATLNPRQSTPTSFQQWEARRSGIAPVVKPPRRKRAPLSSKDFDFQIIRKREVMAQ
jgi:hypothetical protein